MKVTATKLRADLYQILDRVIELGEPVEIERAGGTVVILPKPKKTPTRRRSVRLRRNPQVVVGDPDDLVHFDWSEYWKPIL